MFSESTFVLFEFSCRCGYGLGLKKKGQGWGWSLFARFAREHCSKGLILFPMELRIPAAAELSDFT
jgi:hypothetical protein